MRSSFRFASLLFVPAIVLPAPLAARTLRAQEAPAGTPAIVGGIRGSVIDAETATGLGGSIVTLIPRDGAGAFPPSTGESRFANARTTTTTPAGAYVFGDIGAGSYTLLVHRGGYAPARLDVEVGAAGEARVSVGLLVQPVRLQAVRVEASADVAPSPAFRAGADSSARIRAALERQTLFLSGDVRELTSGEAQEALTLGSSDLLLAMQRLPGVTHVDERSATLWVRGSRWDHTRVYFDGVPLYQPLSALGALSGVNPSAIGTAFLLPGVRPVSLGGDGIARIDLRTGAGTPDGRLRGSAELSLWGATGAVGYRREDDAAGIQVTARQGLNDVFRSEDIPGFGTLRQTSSFRYDEATVRADAALGEGRLEVSGLYSRDELVPRDPRYPVRQEWTTLAGRATYSVPIRALTLSQTIGGTTFDADRIQPPLDAMYSWPDGSLIGQPFPLQNDAGQLSVSTRLASPSDSGESWSAGVDAVSVHAGFRGLRQHLFWGDTTRTDTAGRGTNHYASVWAERRWRPTARLEVEWGGRADVGGSGLPAVRPSMTVQARWAVDDRTAATAGLGRSHQYQQQVSTPRLDWIAGASPWTVAGKDAPVLTSDVATAGLERWRGDGLLLGANVFARRSTGLVVRDPRPGQMTAQAWYTTGRESAYGFEASARKLTGRVTGMLAYSYQHARTTAAGLHFVSDASVPHALDAAAAVRLGAWRIGAGHTLTSGAPSTAMVFGPLITIDSLTGEPVVDGWESVVGRPNARREPVFSRLDLFADWTRRFGRSSLTAFAGARKVFAAGDPWEQLYRYECGDRPALECMEERPMIRSGSFSPTLGLRLTF